MTTQANIYTLTASEAAADTALWAAVARGEATVTWQDLTVATCPRIVGEHAYFKATGEPFQTVINSDGLLTVTETARAIYTLTAAQAAANGTLWRQVADGEATVKTVDDGVQLVSVLTVDRGYIHFNTPNSDGYFTRLRADENVFVTETERKVDVSEDWETWKESYYHLKAVSEIERKIATDIEAENARLRALLADAAAALEAVNDALESERGKRLPAVERVMADRAADVLARIRGNGEAG